MRKRLMAGNWKMFHGAVETTSYVNEFEKWFVTDAGKRAAAAIDGGSMEVAIFPPTISLTAAMAARATKYLGIGAQNAHWEQQGAFTGETSLEMIAEIGCSYVLLGHSERRHIFRESNETIARKVSASLASKLRTVLCVGELLEEREAGTMDAVLKIQFMSALNGIDAETAQNLAAKLVIAYEPVWAIGTGKTASDEDAQSACKFIRGIAREKFSDIVADNLQILYGGSVKPENTAGIMSQPDIDGVLVGGASLKTDQFQSIVLAGIPA